MRTQTNGALDPRRWQRWPAERDDLELPLFDQRDLPENVDTRRKGESA